MTHRDGLPRFLARSVGRSDAAHRKPRATPSESLGRPPFRSLISLQQIMAEALGFGVNTKRVRTAYTRLIETFDSDSSPQPLALFELLCPQRTTSYIPYGAP